MKEKVKTLKKSKLPKPENTEALEKVKSVKSKIEAYYKKNKLDPEKDYTKDKKHGPILNEWMKVLEVNRGKLKDSLPQEVHHKKSEDKKKLKKPQAEKAVKLPKDSRKVTKYDYPLVNGKEMSPDEKRKYRASMRKQNKPKKEPKEQETKKVEKKVKKEVKKVEKKVEKTLKAKAKGDKKKKKND